MLRTSLALCTVASIAAAQAPTFVTFGAGVRVTDIVTLQGGGVVATGYDATQGQAFLWTPAGGFQYIGGVDGGGFQKLSADATVVGSTMAGGARAGSWTAATGWTPVIGLGGSSGGTETTFYGLSGNGRVVVGLGWTIGNIGHAFRAESGTTIDLTPPWNNNPSRANTVNYAGDIVAGWRDQGVRQGVVWVNGTMQSLTYTPPAGGAAQRLGEALGMNQAGDHVVGYNNFDAPTNTAGWIWTRATNSTAMLPNLPNLGAPLPADVTADGTIVVGNGGGLPFGRTAIIWTNGVPQNAKDWLIGLGVPAASQYTQLGNVTACSEDGYAYSGYGSGANFNEPNGWIVYFPQALSVGTPFCAGDGSGAACPCGNSGLAGRGCANSVNADGGRLRGSGTASLAADSVSIYGDGMPNSNALYFQGTTQSAGGAGATFGDGLRCAGGTVVRLGTKTNVAGASSYPGAGDPSVSVRGLVVAPGTRTYQGWYRNAAAFCTASTFNLTNGLEVVWVP